MSTAYQARKNSSSKNLLTKPLKKSDQAGDGCTEAPAPDTAATRCTQDEDAPITQTFLENFFSILWDDIAALIQELAAGVKDIRRKMGELEHRVDSLEQSRWSRNGELEKDCHKILTLRDKTADLNNQVEDLEHRLRCCNIRIKGIPVQADSGKLEDYVLCLFRQVAPALSAQEIILDRTQRVEHPARSPGQPQNMLTFLHYYKQKDAIMAIVQDTSAMDFEGRVSAGLFCGGQVCVVAVFYLERKGRKSTPPPGKAESSVQRGGPRGATPMRLGLCQMTTSSSSLRRELRARCPSSRSATAPAWLLVPRLLLMGMR
ncbi:hypothetical protein NDU88_009011 [Pleurodeles waltl]|uniref:Uncharacterized protein n=1 Tax=Pleurodeles waltl TaxID=8319 RepID=A0AAV7PTF8_PLEWA|nr:hypothetical protein NDU88_009011 [Pleurodeles waltl]